MTKFLALLSGANWKLLNHAEAGRGAWASVGLNILIASLLIGAAAALLTKELLTQYQFLHWIWAGVLFFCLALISMRLSIKYIVPHLGHILIGVVLVLCLTVISLVVSLPFEIKILLIANPGGTLVKSGLIQYQVLEWLKATNGVHTLMLLRIAIRLSSFIVLSLPFFVAWNARNGTYMKVKNAQREIHKIFASIK